MDEELAEDCQRGDNAIKKQVHKKVVDRIYKIFQDEQNGACKS